MTIATVEVTMIPLCRLVKSDGNVRKSDPQVDSLAASILSVGLLQNLVVVPSEDCEGFFDVAAGRRRNRALVKLANEGKIANDYAVPCVVKDRNDETLVSLTENVEREDMSAAEECEAFVHLTTEGRTVDFIADAFGVTPAVVERRLALKKASPVLFELLREGAMSSEQLRALCAAADHERQETIWNTAYDKSPRTLSRLARETTIDVAKDRRVAFIGGVSAFTAAGGVVRGDLLSTSENSGFIDDVTLLEQLVATKLDNVAEGIRGEGWKWVEVQAAPDDDNYRLGRIHAEMVLSDADHAALAPLEANIEQLEGEQSALQDDESEAANARWDEVEEALEVLRSEVHLIKEAARQFSPEQKASAGVIVTLDHDGSLSVLRGRIRAEDRKDATTAGLDIAGGRESKAPGRKEGVSDALKRSLLAHRNIAVATEVSKNAHVAKVLLASFAVEKIRSGSAGSSVPSDLHISSHSWGIRRLQSQCGVDVKVREEAFAELGAILIDGLPKKSEDVWDVLLGWSAERLDMLNAYAVAMSVSVADDHKGLTGKLLAALNFNMAEHFDATVDNYPGRSLPKAFIVKALGEAGKAADKAALNAMKTRDLAKEAEARLAGTGWVPSLIRTPGEKPQATKKPAKPKAAKKKPEA